MKKKLRRRKMIELLKDSGLLFELNRQVLHPYGFRLAIRTNWRGKCKELILQDDRDYKYGVVYTKEAFIEGMNRIQKYAEEEGWRFPHRRRVLGGLIQKEPYAKEKLDIDGIP
jgi:hypothetical protein